MIDVENCDLLSLFMFRYALDRPNDTVDLQRDILDLQSFPERLNDSYKDEWQTYVKRELHKKQRAGKQEMQALIARLSDLEKQNDETFNRLRSKIDVAVKVNNSPDVTVMTTPLKSYVNQLLKI